MVELLAYGNFPLLMRCCQTWRYWAFWDAVSNSRLRVQNIFRRAATFVYPKGHRTWNPKSTTMRRKMSSLWNQGQVILSWSCARIYKPDLFTKTRIGSKKVYIEIFILHRKSFVTCEVIEEEKLVIKHYDKLNSSAVYLIISHFVLLLFEKF